MRYLLLEAKHAAAADMLHRKEKHKLAYWDQAWA